ncbi:MAG: alpha/beta hydrolase [Candidatus Micrarchaeota archaeon]|nr:alpha/beta hydrolase [Candidatus Micrarchaeota archaeon]
MSKTVSSGNSLLLAVGILVLLAFTFLLFKAITGGLSHGPNPTTTLNQSFNSTPSTTTVSGPTTTVWSGRVVSLGYSGIANITYCDGQVLSIFYPPSYAAGRSYPTLVFIHGGGWSKGNGGTWHVQENQGENLFLNSSFIVVNVDYRLAPQYQFPAMIEDVKCAVRFLRANAARYGINSTRIAADGGSAGSHLALLLGVANRSSGWDTGPYLNYSSSVRAVIDQYGPANLTNPYFYNLHSGLKGGYLFQNVFDLTSPTQPAAYADSPVYLVSPGDSPFLIVQGEEDTVVPYNQSVMMYNSLRSKGDAAQFISVANAGHGFVQVSSSPISPSLTQIHQDELAFLQKYD